MPELEPQATPATSADPAQGTSQQGQAQSGASVTSGTPNDPAAFQADYTKKYQELSAEKQRIEAEKATIEAEKIRLAQMYRPVQHNQQQQQHVDPLVEQFGVEGAQAIRQGVAQPLYQQLFLSEYQREETLGKAKYGEEAWNKLNYVDPMTGEQKNKIMDLRIKGIPLQEAWNATNPVSREAIEEEVRKKIYAEIEAKAAGKPASAPSSGAPSQGTGAPSSTEEAFQLAKKSLGMG